MSVLLYADTVELYPPGSTDDSHGWVLPDPPPVAASWTGSGNLQLAPGRTEAGADSHGGQGPFGPLSAGLGVLFLPPDAAPADGFVAVVRGKQFILRQTHFVADPTGSGSLDCWVSSVDGTEPWGGDVGG